MNIKPKALLIDITKCIGCRACETTCKEVHGFATDKPTPVLSDAAFTIVEERAEGKFVRRMCQHCQEPSCASACPVGALKKSAFGPVVYEGEKCIGCRYCMIACPYQVPKYQWSKLAPYMVKCDMCIARVSQGQPTACAEACPVQATIFGDRDEMLKESQKRLIENPAYIQHIYGSEELGGTSVFYISDVAFDRLGFPIGLSEQPLPKLSKAALGDVPTVVSIGGSLLAGLYWITQRRQEVLMAEGKQPTNSPANSQERR
jgi:formate dehydrogenase iron-sulfur subunit